MTEVLRIDALKDYALLRLDSRIGDTYGWLELDTTTQVDSSQHVKIIQHPKARSKEIARRNSQIVDIPAGHTIWRDPFALAYLADIEPGSSGSPVFLRDGTGVIGIHHSAWPLGGLPHFNSGTLMSHIVPEIQQWLPSRPYLPKVPDKAYTKGTAIAPYTLPQALETFAVGAVTYTLTGLPAGLSFDPTSRTLTGTPNPTNTGVTTATYTATDTASNADNVSFTITVNPVVSLVAPANFPAAGTSYLRGQPFADMTVPNATGGTGDPANYTYAVTGLPTGLTFNATGKEITGTPTAAGVSTVTITATDTVRATGSADFTITVTAAPALIFSHVVAPQTYEVGTPITQVSLPEGSGGIPPYTYALAPIPDGLSFSPTTRVLSGTPTTAQAAKDHTYTISDSAFSHVTSPSAGQGPNTSTLPINITVTAAPPTNQPPDFGNATVDNIVATVGTAIQARTLPTATDPDGDTLTYSISPALPAGLSFNTSTRVLKGTPSAAMPQTACTYRVEDGNGGEDTIGFSMTVKAAPPTNRPPDFGNASVDNIVATVGQAIQERTLPTATDPEGDTLTYSISPALPTGLSFNASTRILTGTPSAVLPQTAYTYQVSDGKGGADTIGFFITVNPAPPGPTANQPPDFGNASVDNIVARVGQAIQQRTLPTATDPDGDTLTYSISPALLTGLNFNATNRILTGTPSAAIPQTTYTYQVSDGKGGADTIGFFITVNAEPTAPPTNRPPDFGNASVDNIVATVGTAIQARTLPTATDPEGDTLTYAIVETLPTGLSFNTSTRVLTGAPSTAIPQTAYTYQVEDGNGGKDTISFSMTVNAAPTAPPTNQPPDFGNATVENIVATVDQAIQAHTLPTATDPEGDTLTYAIVETLPEGLSFNASTRILTGTPTATMVETAYTYQVEDGNGGADTIGFFITVNAEPTAPPTAPPTNQPPDFGNATVENIIATVGQAIQERTLPTATDPDGDTLTYAIVETLPEGLIFNASTRILTGTPTAIMVETAYTYQVEDGNGGADTIDFFITVNALDVNGDRQVTVIDLVMVALFYGTRVPTGISLPADVNADSVVDILDLVAVAQGVDAASGTQGLWQQEIEAALLAAAEQAAEIETIAEAPNASFHGNRTYRNVAAALTDVKPLATDDMRLGKGVLGVLEALLQLLTEMKAIPETSALLPNYPNPFNPETWLPYQLATPAAVTLSIYSVDGQLVRTLKIGHQPAGVYRSKHRAAYWDGKNRHGEPVASGVYFYTLTAGDFTATRKLSIAK